MINTNLYYILDIIIAIALPLFIIFGYLKDRVPFTIWKLYWIGCLIGSTWEFALYFNKGAANPVLHMLTPFPGGDLMHSVLHTFWDGGLFVAGYLLIIWFSRTPKLKSFSWSELGIMIVWGQVQELFVETSGTLMGAWTYSGNISWNPVLFYLGEGQITLIPQVVWFFASIGFYFICRKLVE